MIDQVFKIEQGIPLPKPRRGPKASAYPWEEMKVADSFLVPLNGDKSTTVQRRVASAAATRKRSTGEEFATRMGEDGVRVWRIA